MKKKVQRAEKVSGNLDGSYSKKDSVINKKGMVDRRDSISEGEAWERSFRLKSDHFSAKGLSYQNVYERG